MQSNQSPGGSKFPYYYKGGQLYCLHLGSYGADEQKVIDLIGAETDFLLGQCRSMPVWVDFYETKLTSRVLAAWVVCLVKTHALIPKLGVVGCGWVARWRMRRALARAPELAALPVRYFADPEDAKTWIVSERR